MNSENGGNMMSKYAGKTVLAIGAHPDDLELGAGGTLAKLARSGTRVVMAIVSVPSDFENRQEEAKRAAALLGAELRILVKDRNSRVEDMKTYELVNRIDGLVREFKPAMVLSHGSADLHNDHVLVYNASMAAQRSSYHDFFCYFPTSTRPISVPYHPHAYVDITETIDDKIESIHVHATQFEERGLGAEFYRNLAQGYGRVAGVDYAEGLEVVRLRLA